ncbi:hypothetical protein [Spirosoma endophyticum]|uniref:Uncharacterized protein n=1 Tax=Spirosoma endophyticum TaxID=662367 RepID=A0A1I1VLH4_9BACT|nr:hypothetical protein [Spirosoma endophyticum]SFD83674.1 hypothetical protein SAMN05216167_107236 [Spirosoma endophyticum]
MTYPLPLTSDVKQGENGKGERNATEYRQSNNDECQLCFGENLSWLTDLLDV